MTTDWVLSSFIIIIMRAVIYRLASSWVSFLWISGRWRQISSMMYDLASVYCMSSAWTGANSSPAGSTFDFEPETCVHSSQNHISKRLITVLITFTSYTVYYCQGRLSLSTDGDKCAMVNFGGEWKSLILIVWILCTNLIINNLQFTVSEIWLWCF